VFYDARCFISPDYLATFQLHTKGYDSYPDKNKSLLPEKIKGKKYLKI